MMQSFADLLGDPDEGLVLRDDFAEELRRFITRSTSADERPACRWSRAGSIRPNDP